ncbi:MAG: hypothetical protein KJS92_04800 [Bacteroidetes bacterium]|nr:hypothetical protein [Bacteroidota bacterium]
MSHLALWAGLGMNRLSEATLEIPGVRITWLIPEPPVAHEPREAWIQRMAKFIPPDADFIGGFSLGGMLALEHVPLLPQCRGLLLMSYAANRNSWRNYLRLAASSGLLHMLLLIPSGILLRMALWFLKIFGRNTHGTMKVAMRAWTPSETVEVLRFLLKERTKNLSVPILQVIGTQDPWLRPGPGSTAVTGAGHFFFPKYKMEISRNISLWIKSLV